MYELGSLAWTSSIRDKLPKLAGLVGKPLKVDRATTQKERLTYAHVLVEVKPHKKYPNSIMFEDERGRIVEYEVFYDKKPILCGKCKKFGHEMQECRKLGKASKLARKPRHK